MYLKWAGGKTKIANEVAKHFPHKIHGAYIEPFFGSGAMYFAMKAATSEPDLFKTDGFTPYRYIFNDSNPLLVNCHLVVRDLLEELKEALKKKELAHLQDPQSFYNQQRYHITSTSITNVGKDIEMAASFIYINKSCFNGLWRVNQKGEFNVPWNTETKVNLVTNKLDKANKYLLDCDIHLGDALSVLSDLKSDDFVYLDPPYVPISESSHFTAYTKEDFSPEKLVILREKCDKLSDQGIKWCMSNSIAPFVYETFKEYHITEIDAPRFIKPMKDDDRRISVKETIVTNYIV